MAASAIIDYANVVHRRSREIGELRHRMADLARSACRQVVARLGFRGHTCKHLTVVASRATADDAGVDHRSSCEIGELARRVAKLASCSGWQVITRLGYRCHTGKYLAVMAGCATTKNAGVDHRRPGEVSELAR